MRALVLVQDLPFNNFSGSNSTNIHYTCPSNGSRMSVAETHSAADLTRPHDL